MFHTDSNISKFNDLEFAKNPWTTQQKIEPISAMLSMLLVKFAYKPYQKLNNYSIVDESF